MLAKISVLHMFNSLHGPRNDALGLFIPHIPHHRVGLAAARLPIGENSSVITVEDVLDGLFGDQGECVLLVDEGWQHPVQSVHRVVFQHGGGLGQVGHARAAEAVRGQLLLDSGQWAEPSVYFYRRRLGMGWGRLRGGRAYMRRLLARRNRFRKQAGVAFGLAPSV